MTFTWSGSRRLSQWQAATHQAVGNRKGAAEVELCWPEPQWWLVGGAPEPQRVLRGREACLPPLCRGGMILLALPASGIRCYGLMAEFASDCLPAIVPRSVDIAWVLLPRGSTVEVRCT